VRDIVVRPIYADEQSGVRLRHALVIVPYVLTRVLAQRAYCFMLGLARGARPSTEPHLIEAKEREVQPNV
jgi:hypothetical protein